MNQKTYCIVLLFLSVVISCSACKEDHIIEEAQEIEVLSLSYSYVEPDFSFDPTGETWMLDAIYSFSATGEMENAVYYYLDQDSNVWSTCDRKNYVLAEVYLEEEICQTTAESTEKWSVEYEYLENGKLVGQIRESDSGETLMTMKEQYFYTNGDDERLGTYIYCMLSRDSDGELQSSLVEITAMDSFNSGICTQIAYPCCIITRPKECCHIVVQKLYNSYWATKYDSIGRPLWFCQYNKNGVVTNYRVYTYVVDNFRRNEIKRS